MAELDTLMVHNPTEKGYDVGYNGENYRIEPLQEKAYPQHLARHIAKRISDDICITLAKLEVEKLEAKKAPVPATLSQQIGMLDNPHRRIALYKIFRSEEEVIRTLSSYPQFKVRNGEFNFIGDISIYEKFVEDFNKVEEKAEVPKEEPEEDVEDVPDILKEPDAPAVTQKQASRKKKKSA